SICFLTLVAQAAAVNPIPHPEHPRPDFERRPWVNLNGTWRFAFDAEDVGETQQWFESGKHTFEKEIVVPFPWESRLSGIGDTEYRGVAWYAREIEIPTGDGWQDKQPWLVIGACDWEAKVWVNGHLVGEHTGGYTPFAVSLAPHAEPGSKAFVVIRAKDITDPQQPVGKQVNWYTRTSGLWQTVYLEPRSAVHIQNLRFTCAPDLAKPEADCPINYDVTFNEAADNLRVELFVGDEPVGHGNTKVAGRLAAPKLWHPNTPHLYDARLVVKDGDTVVDEVHTYFGVRTVGTMTAPGRDYKYITLNGEPIYLRGALHQSFHPEGVYHYPDDAAVRSDYEYCKKIGLNFLRIHIKTPIPREIYWADKLGVLIMEDVPNYWKHTAQAQTWWEQAMRAAVTRDFNHPAIFAWCDFNETWGIGDGEYDAERQAWVADMYHLTKQLDPTRLCEDNSPCRYDHVITDINSWHFYINEYNRARDHIREVVEKTFPGSTFNYAKGYSQADAPLINSEYGGIGAGQGDQDISWCFKYLTNELRKHDKICGYVYTELSDIEWEHNGFMNYDRTDKEFGYDFWHPGFSLKDLNGADF
ncbi:MAG TPA: glycoside hydrolase family 2, partial [Firmicutes bacterium]|nr:glycoside hydrolase family 2 [Bacillota bacterium]